MNAYSAQRETTLMELDACNATLSVISALDHLNMTAPAAMTHSILNTLLSLAHANVSMGPTMIRTQTHALLAIPYAMVA